MEALLHGDDLESAVAVQRSPFACELYRAFVGLGPAVAKKYLVQSAMYCEQLRQPDHRFVIKSRAAIYQALSLRHESRDDRAWRMPQAVDSPPLNEIKKAATF